MPSPTRGSGLLETWLAQKRVAMALALIPSVLEHGHIVDIGCGLPPMLLRASRASQKTGIDLRLATTEYEGIRMIAHECSLHRVLPCANASAEVVTMLAMIEHVDADVGAWLLTEIHRILAPGGMIILTTPTRCSTTVLQLMAHCGLVSAQEINDHSHMYNPHTLNNALHAAGFVDIRTGRFECGLNVWATGSKSR